MPANRKFSQHLLAVFVVLGAITTMASRCAAEELPGSEMHDDQPDQPDEINPSISTDARWIGGMAIIFGGLFMAAAIAGPIVRREMPEAVPEAMSHVEDPAVDRDESII